MTPVTATNLLRHELIGLDVMVCGDLNKYNNRINGEILDETRNTLTIRSNGVAKMVIKSNAFFEFNIGGSRVEVEGSALVGRPEDRVKKKMKRSW